MAHPNPPQLKIQNSKFKIPHFYVHIPFCHEKCGYCDFATATVDSKASATVFHDYLGALQAQLTHATSFFGKQNLESIYFGGGTPSVWPTEYLKHFLEAVRAKHTQSHDVEITVECNPNSLSLAKLDAYRKLGVTRLSLGVQSLQPRSFETLGRSHSIEQSLQALQWLQQHWKKSFSVDLMFGLPHQTLDDFHRDLQTVLGFKPPHLSVYGLILEKTTAFGKKYQLRQRPLPNEDAEADMYAHVMEHLAKQAYQHYELSSFALPGHASRHNQAYWQDKNYLGLGLSAASYVEGQRFTGTANLKTYLAEPCPDYARLMQRSVPSDKRLSEKLFLMMRTSEGIHFSKLSPRERDIFDQDIRQELQKWVTQDFVAYEKQPETWRLNLKGKMIADEIMQVLV